MNTSLCSGKLAFVVDGDMSCPCFPQVWRFGQPELLTKKRSVAPELNFPRANSARLKDARVLESIFQGRTSSLRILLRDSAKNRQSLFNLSSAKWRSDSSWIMSHLPVP
jgi:hypothetical protein